jgi:hypothetical protein
MVPQSAFTTPRIDCWAISDLLVDETEAARNELQSAQTPEQHRLAIAHLHDATTRLTDWTLRGIAPADYFKGDLAGSAGGGRYGIRSRAAGVKKSG